MRPFSYLSVLACSQCGKSFDPHQVQTICHTCNAPLLSIYDLTSLQKEVDRDELSHRSSGMWRWLELLPITHRESIVSLGEGDTPLLKLRSISLEIGLSNLYLKDESQNPTGSFKARGLSVAVSKAVELGIKRIVIPSAGNAGGALAAYAARAGIQSLIIMPEDVPPVNIVESTIMGARVELVNGLIDKAGKTAQEVEEADGWFNMATFKEPYRVEGKKIMGYEIAEFFDWKLPDKILYPTGGGTGLVGMWKAFLEMEALGWLESGTKPQMIAVQAEGCAPIIKAFKSNQESGEVWENAHTIATGLCVPRSFADRLILKYLHDSHGDAVSVTDNEIIHSRRQLAQKEGIFCCPEGAATLAGLHKLVTNGKINKNENIVLFNTGSGLKYLESTSM